MLGELAKTGIDLIKSKINKAKVDYKLTNKLTRDIGPESIVGAKNYDTHHKTIGDFVKKGKIGDANSYVKNQSQKLSGQLETIKKRVK